MPEILPSGGRSLSLWYWKLLNQHCLPCGEKWCAVDGLLEPREDVERLLLFLLLLKPAGEGMGDIGLEELGVHRIDDLRHVSNKEAYSCEEWSV